MKLVGCLLWPVTRELRSKTASKKKKRKKKPPEESTSGKNPAWDRTRALRANQGTRNRNWPWCQYQEANAPLWSTLRATGPNSRLACYHLHHWGFVGLGCLCVLESVPRSLAYKLRASLPPVAGRSRAQLRVCLLWVPYPPSRALKANKERGSCSANKETVRALVWMLCSAALAKMGITTMMMLRLSQRIDASTQPQHKVGRGEIC